MEGCAGGIVRFRVGRTCVCTNPGDRMRKYRFIIVFTIIALSAFSIFTCRYLPFDRELEMTAFALSKLKLENTVGPLDMNSCVDDNVRFYFMPDKGAFSSGFIVIGNVYGQVGIFYRYPDGSFGNSLQFNVTDASPYKPNVLIEPLSGEPGVLLVILYNYVSGSQEPNYHVLRAQPLPSHTLEESVGETMLLPMLPGASSMNGAFIHPSDNRLYMLYTDNGVPKKFRESNAIVTSSGIGTRTTTRPISPVDSFWPVDLFYSYDPSTSKSFIAYPLMDGFHNSWWNDSIYDTFPDHYPRVRILSNGSLLSFDKGIIYCFDQGGTQQYRIPVGELNYLYEFYNSADSQYYMVFSLARISYPYDDKCKPSITFRVYSYPTKDVAKLSY